MYLVTGGAGFIGSNLVAELAGRGDGVVVCDWMRNDDRWRNLCRHELVDLITPEALLPWLTARPRRLRAVLHMGAISATTETDVDLIAQLNIRATLDLLDWCSQSSTPFIYASSAATYGDGSAGFDDEFTIGALAALRPLNAYGWSKHLVDRRLARLVADGARMPSQWAGLKFFNVYGPNEYHKGTMQSVIARNFETVRDGAPMQLFRSYRPDYADGGQLRDFIYVKDCIAVMMWLLENPHVSGLFNVGTGRARSWLDLSAALMRACGHEPRVEFIDMPATLVDKYQYFTQARMERLASAGFTRPFTSLEEGVTDYVQRYLASADRVSIGGGLTDTARSGRGTTRLRISRALAHLRHRFRRGTGLVLARLLGPRRPSQTLDLAGIRSVLVCRINGRMGNTLFLTPLIRQLHALLPEASIDLALAYKRSPELLGDMPGVRQIIIFPHKTDRMVRRFLRALRRLRAQRYDLAIDPVPESNSGRVVMTLCRADRRLGFVTERQWAPLTHAVPPPRQVTHQAAHPVYLVDQAIGTPYDADSVRLWLPLRTEELAAGRELIVRSIAHTGTANARRVIGFFAHAAGFKILGGDWWTRFWQLLSALEPDAIPLECLPTPGQAPTVDGITGFHEPSPRALAAAIASVRMFISTDTGPMHLASSTDVPTVALFRVSDPLQYGPLKPSDVSIDVGRTGLEGAAYICQRVWRCASA